MSDWEKHSRNDFESFGDMLKYLRKSYGERTGSNQSGGPRVTLTALSLIECLGKHDYPITSGAFSVLESGATLPKDPRRFFNAIFQCLAIGPTSKYRVLLKRQYGYDLLVRYVGADEAEAIVPHGPAALEGWPLEHED